MVSVTTTATSTPSRARSPARSARRTVRIDGQQRDLVPGDVGGVDARRRLDDAEPVGDDLGAALRGEQPDGLVVHQRAAGGVAGLGVVRHRDQTPSTLETTFEVTTTTSPSTTPPSSTPARTAARSSPGRNSGSPGTPHSVRPREPWSPRPSDTGEVERRADHRRGGLGVGHHQRHGADLDAGHLGRVPGRDEPAVEQATGGPGAVVASDPSALTGTPTASRHASAMPRTA